MGFCTLSIVRYSKEHKKKTYNVSETGSVSVLRWVGGRHLLGWLGKNVFTTWKSLYLCYASVFMDFVRWLGLLHLVSTCIISIFIVHFSVSSHSQIPISGAYIAVVTLTEVVQWLGLPLSNGTNRAGVFSHLITWGRKQIQFPKLCVL
jgi:hypothetical protein